MAGPRAAAAISPTPISDTQAIETIRIEQPLYVAELTNRGAGLTSWKLTQYRDTPSPSSPPVELVTAFEPGGVALATPFTELGLGDLSTAAFRIVERGVDTVTFEYVAGGVTVRKTFLFDADNYVVRLRLEVRTVASAAVEPTFEVIWPARERGQPSFFDERLSVMHGGKVERVAVSSVGDPGLASKLTGSSGTVTPTFTGDVDWVAADSRYFLAALMPDLPRDAVARFVKGASPKQAQAELMYTPVTVPGGHGTLHDVEIYVGPKELDRLSAVGSNLQRTVDLGYSWVAPLTKAFLWLLHACYSIIPNYGVGIILLTVLVRLVTAPLTSRQMRSMAKMGKLQPQIKALQEKYADDRPRQSQETMKLYKESGVNPLGGCLPILLQFPVFIGLYYALQSSIDLRHAPFFGWIHDLSAPEQIGMLPGVDLPIRILPIVMGASMVLQQKLTPQTTMDPTQARMMMTVMPVMFTVLFYQFPSGLVLYWLVSNLLAVAHQWWLKRSMAGEK